MFARYRSPSLVWGLLVSFTVTATLPPARAQLPSVPATSATTLKSVVRSTFIAQPEEKVEPLSGRLLMTCTDVIVQAGAVDLRLERSVQLFPNRFGLLGMQWALNWERFLLRSDGIVAILENGAATEFLPEDRPGVYRSAAGDVLRFIGTEAQCERVDGSIESYDAEGRLIEQDARNGNVIRLQYDASGRLNRIEGPYESFLQFQVGSDGLLREVRASNGSWARYAHSDEPLPDGFRPTTSTYGYDEAGRLNRIAAPQSGNVAMTYDAEGRVTSREWSDGSREQFDYDTANNTTRYTDVSNHVAVLRRDAETGTVELTSADGRRITMKLDEQGRPLHIVDPAGRVGRVEYDSLGRGVRVELPGQGMHEYAYHAESPIVTSIVDPDHQRRTFQYDLNHNLLGVRLQGETGSLIDFQYQPDGQVRSVRAGGVAFTVSYDKQGRPHHVANQLGDVASFEFDRQANLVRSVDAVGNASSFAYDAIGRQIAETDPLGATTGYEYDELGRLAAHTNAMGGRTTYAYDGRGRRIATTDPLDRTTHYARYPNGLLKSVTDPLGHVVHFTYDAAGRIVEEVSPGGVRTVRQYDKLGRHTGDIDALGSTTRYEYDDADRLIAIQFADDSCVRYEYDTRGNLIAETDARGRVTKHEYDRRGNRTATQRPSGERMEQRYDEQDRMVSASVGKQEIVRHTYDAAGNRTRSVFASGRQVDYEFDAEGRMTAWKDNLRGGESFRHDAAGRRIEVTDATGRSIRYRYDLVGHLLGVTDALGESQRRTYDAAGQVVEVVQPGGDRLSLVYDKAGNVVRIAKSNGGIVKFAYDPQGHPTQTTDPFGATSATQYDAVGRVAARTDALGQTTRFAYDSSGRLVQKALADGSVVSFRYDDRGDLIEIDDGEYPIKYSYDERGNRTKIEYPAIRRSLNYSYDHKDRVIQFVDSEGNSVEYEYDDLDRLSVLRNGDATYAFSYDAKGRRVSVAWPNGVVGRWKYDGADRVNGITYDTADGRSLLGWGYEYDDVGNVRAIKSQDGTKNTFRFDPDGQLVEEATGDQRVRYAYQSGGNRSRHTDGDNSVSYRYNEADQLVAAGDDQFRYDAAGNLVERRDKDGVTQFTYDVQNQLVKVELPDGKTVRYGYGPTGKRIWREAAGRRTWFVNDGAHVLAELDSRLQAEATYVHGFDVDRPLACHKGDRHQFLHADRIGSIRGVTDGQSRLASQVSYTAFGKRHEESDDASVRVGFTGRWYDNDTGLYYYRARWYDPDLGRFLTKDPVPGTVEAPLSVNPYQYAFNNPLGYVDPLGTASWADGYLARIQQQLASGQMTTEEALNAVTEGKRWVDNWVRDYGRGVPHPVYGPGYNSGQQVMQNAADDFAALAAAQRDLEARPRLVQAPAPSNPPPRTPRSSDGRTRRPLGPASHGGSDSSPDVPHGFAGNDAPDAPRTSSTGGGTERRPVKVSSAAESGGGFGFSLGQTLVQTADAPPGQRGSVFAEGTAGAAAQTLAGVAVSGTAGNVAGVGVAVVASVIQARNRRVPVRMIIANGIITGTASAATGIGFGLLGGALGFGLWPAVVGGVLVGVAFERIPLLARRLRTPQVAGPTTTDVPHQGGGEITPDMVRRAQQNPGQLAGPTSGTTPVDNARIQALAQAASPGATTTARTGSSRRALPALPKLVPPPSTTAGSSPHPAHPHPAEPAKPAPTHEDPSGTYTWTDEKLSAICTRFTWKQTGDDSATVTFYMDGRESGMMKSLGGLPASITATVKRSGNSYVTAGDPLGAAVTTAMNNVSRQLQGSQNSMFAYKFTFTPAGKTMKVHCDCASDAPLSNGPSDSIATRK